MKLSDVMKMKARAKNASNVQQAKEMAALLREREAQRKRDIDAANERYREALREAEELEERTKAAEHEAKKRPYFVVDKYNRQIPTEGEPLYWGDTRQAGTAWEPHGMGKFILDGEVNMEGQFIKGALVQGLVRWRDGSLWEGSMEEGRMNGVGFITYAEAAEGVKGVKGAEGVQRARREVIMRNNVITCYREGEWESGRGGRWESGE
jgi:hypothetical protein